MCAANIYQLFQFRTAILPTTLLKFFKDEQEEANDGSSSMKQTNGNSVNEETLRAMASVVTLALKPVVNPNDRTKTITEGDENW